MDIHPAGLNTKSIYLSSNPSRIPQKLNLHNPKELKQDTVSFTANNIVEELNGGQIYLYEDIDAPQKIISGEDGKQEISIIANMNVKTIRNSYAPIKIANCNISTSFINNAFKGISIFEAKVKATNKINNDSGNIDIFRSNIDSRYVKNSYGDVSIKDSTVSANVLNSWGNIEAISTNNEKCKIKGRLCNEWGNISIKGESKDNRVVIDGNLENVSGFVNLKNAEIIGTLKASGDRIILNNSEIENLVIDSNYDENNGKNLLTRFVNMLSINNGKEQIFVLKKGNKINGDVTFVSGNGKLVVEDGAEFNGNINGGELVNQ